MKRAANPQKIEIIIETFPVSVDSNSEKSDAEIHKVVLVKSEHQKMTVFKSMSLSKALAKQHQWKSFLDGFEPVPIAAVDYMHQSRALVIASLSMMSETINDTVDSCLNEFDRAIESAEVKRTHMEIEENV